MNEGLLKPINISLLKNISYNNTRNNDYLETFNYYRSIIRKHINKIIHKLVTQENILKYGNFNDSSYYIPIFGKKITIKNSNKNYKFMINDNWNNTYNIIFYERYIENQAKPTNCLYTFIKYFKIKKKKTTEQITYDWKKLNLIIKKYNRMHPSSKYLRSARLIFKILNEFEKDLKEYNGLKVSAAYNINYNGSMTHGLLFSWN